LFGIKWKCRHCGQAHDDMPVCFGIEAPWRALVSGEVFHSRVELSDSWCVVGDEHFFVRGHIEIPIINHATPLTFSVWSSLSEENFNRRQDRWNDPDRGDDPPNFGWLCSPIRPYDPVLHLPLLVQDREPGMVPLFTVTQIDHPLAIDQNNGITIAQWHKMALSLLH
jgi:hypothetical protein